MHIRRLHTQGNLEDSTGLMGFDGFLEQLVFVITLW